MSSIETRFLFFFLLLLLRECLNLFPALIAFFLKEPILVFLSPSELSASDLLSFLSSLCMNPSKHGLANRSREPDIPFSFSEIDSLGNLQAQNPLLVSKLRS
uniref:Uncharacterized protein n=1 Tax=Arundo donax TaxID=35708 RepID=A0A0A9CTZ2_ARUDO